MIGARLRVERVSMSFGGNRALDAVTFEVEPGAVHAVIGPNGAGKSTLFNVLSGVYRPRAGRILLDDRDLLGMAPHRVAALGVGRAFQNASMVTALSVEDNLMLGRHRWIRSTVLADGLHLPWTIRRERAARARVREVAEFVGIAHLLGLPAGALAYGAAKRVDLARALASDPRILLLDEPAAGSNGEEKQEMGRTIRAVADQLGTTVLLVEHDMPLVMSVADRVTVLDFGTVLVTEAPSVVQHDPAVIRAYLGATREADATSPVDGFDPSTRTEG